MTDHNTTRDMVTSSYDRMKATLEPGQEILWTFFLPTREVQMFLGRLACSKDGLVRFQGEDVADAPITLVVHQQHLSFLLEVRDSAKPPRAGFITD